MNVTMSDSTSIVFDAPVAHTSLDNKKYHTVRVTTRKAATLVFVLSFVGQHRDRTSIEQVIVLLNSDDYTRVVTSYFDAVMSSFRDFVASNAELFGEINIESYEVPYTRHGKYTFITSSITSGTLISDINNNALTQDHIIERRFGGGVTFRLNMLIIDGKCKLLLNSGVVHILDYALAETLYQRAKTCDVFRVRAEEPNEETIEYIATLLDLLYTNIDK